MWQQLRLLRNLLVWLRNMLGEIGLPQSEPTTIYEDNQACIVMASQKMVSGRNKHMELKQHYVRDMVARNMVRLVYIKTTFQRADILTKNLAYSDFMRIRDLLLGQSPHEP